MATRGCVPLVYNVEEQVCVNQRYCTCVKNLTYNPQSNVDVHYSTQTRNTRRRTSNSHTSADSNTGYRDLPRRDTSSSSSRGFLDNSERQNGLTWVLVNLLILANTSNAFPQGSSIVANFEQTYCQPQVEALNRAPNHVDPRLCGGTCTPRPVTSGRYTIQVNTTEYSIHNVQVDIRASSGANILGFAVVAVSERNTTAGRWVVQEDRNPTVTRATCDALLQGQVIFHARASGDRSQVTITWDSRRTNFGRIFFRAWIVQRHSEVFVLDSEPLINRLNASAFVSLESKFTEIIAGIRSTASTSRQQTESVLVNSTTRAPSTISATQNSTPSLTTTNVTQQPEISTPSATTTNVTQQPKISTPSPTSTNVTEQPESLPISSTIPTSAFSNVISSTRNTEVTQAQSGRNQTNHASNSRTRENNSTSAGNAGMPSSVSFKEFEAAFDARMSNGYQIHDENPFASFNRASFQLSDFIPETYARRISNNTPSDPFRAELASETNSPNLHRDIQSTNRPSGSQVSEQTAGPGQLQGQFWGSLLDPNQVSLAGQLQGGPLQFQGQLPWQQQGRFQGPFPWQQRPFSAGFPGQTPEQMQGQFPGQNPVQQQGQFPDLFQFQQGQFPGQSPFQQQGQSPGQSPFQQQGQFPGQSQQRGQFPGQSPFQQQGQFPGQSQQRGQFPGQSPFQQQGQFPGQSPFQQQGQFPSQSQFQQQGQFPGQSQQRGQFPGQSPFQEQGQFPGQSQFQQQGQFPGQSPFQQQGQFSGQSPFQQQGQFTGQSPFQQQGQFLSQTFQQGQIPGQSPFQQGQFSGQALLQGGQFPGQFSWPQQGPFLNQASGRIDGDNLGFGSAPSGTSLMANTAANNPGSSGLNNFPNQAQFGSATSGLSTWNSLGSFGNQGSTPFRNEAFGQNLQHQMNNALIGQSNHLQNQNGGFQTNQLGGFFHMFGGNPTARWQGSNQNVFGSFANAARMFG